MKFFAPLKKHIVILICVFSLVFPAGNSVFASDLTTFFSSVLDSLGFYMEGKTGLGDDVYIRKNLGVGTVTPTAKLQVEDSGDTKATIKSTSGTNSATLELSSGTKTNKASTDATGNLHIQTNSAQHVLIQDSAESTGNVGVGTQTPTEKLDVNGYVKTSQGIKFSDGTVQSSAMTNDITISNGNVGVGIQTPAEKLDVNGMIKTSQGIKFGDGSIQTSASSGSGSGSGSYLKSTFTAAENLQKGDIVRTGISNAFPINTITQSTIGAGWDSYLGYSANVQKIGQTIKVTQGNSITQSSFWIKKVGNPTGNIIAKIYNNNGTQEFDTSSTVIIPSNITTTATKYTFNFGNNILSTGSTYLVSLEASNIDVNNYYLVSGYYDYSYSNGTYAQAGTSWSIAGGRDLTFEVTEAIRFNEDINKIYKASANSAYTAKILGIVTENHLIGEPTPVATQGLFVFDNAYVANINYYLSNTPGLISTSPGTERSLVGSFVTNTIFNILPQNSKIYPQNIFISFSQLFNANTVYTITHNLNVSQSDVENGRYKVIITGSSNGGFQAGDTTFYSSIWGAVSSTYQNIQHAWSTLAPTTTNQVQWQANSLQIKWGSQTGYNARVIIQQMW